MAKKQINQKPRLKNLDDLFQLNGGEDLLTQDEPIEIDQQKIKKNLQANVSINRFVPFEKHPFRLYEGERLEDMVESIRTNGIIVPIIARQSGVNLEILAGHNRINAAKILGLPTVPAIILENISDTDAWIYVVETNLIQRSFTDMLHSKKATVIAMQHSKLFSQGKRNDILNELKMLEKPHDYGENSTFPQLGEKLHADKIVAEKYSLSKNTIARYLRINHLIPNLRNRLDMDEIAFIPAVTISFLNEIEQQLLNECVELNNFKVDMKKADILREYSEKSKLGEENVFLILSGELGQKAKPNRTPVVKVHKAVYAKYFKPNQSVAEVQDIVEKALEFYFSRG